MPPSQPQTPSAVTSQLEQLPPQQLLHMFSNPTDKTPKWAVVSAYAKAVEQQRLMEAAGGQQAMQQAQAQMQQPPVAMQVMSQPLTPPAPPVQYARHGGIMHGYAGGGMVQRFAGGSGPQGIGSTQEEQDRARIISALESAGLGVQTLAAAGYDVLSMPVRALFGIYNTLARGPRAFGANIPFIENAGTETMTPAMDALTMRQTYRDPSRALDVLAPPTASGAETPTAFRPSQNYGAAMPPSPGPGPTSRPASRPGSGIAAALRAAAPAAPAAGLAGLMGPEAPTGLLAARSAAQQIEDALRSRGPTPEQMEARSGLDALMKQVIGERQAEEARRLEQAQTRMSEARARAGRPIFDDLSAIGEMLAGVRGSKTFGEALSGAAMGAGRAQNARQDAMRRAEERYDMTRNEIATLAGLRQQLQIEQARAAEARASGDARAAQEAALKVAQTRMQLAEFEAGLADKSEGRRIERERIAATISEGAANRAASLELERIKAAARNAPYSQAAEIMRKVGADPLLQELAKKAAQPDLYPNARADYDKALKEAIARTAPELLIGFGGAAGGSGAPNAALLSAVAAGDAALNQ
jgi:hypothetical protein